MNKLIGLKEWNLSKSSSQKRTVELKIYLKHPTLKSIINYRPVERKKKITEYLIKNYSRLIKTKLFNDYELIGNKKRPAGIKTKMDFSLLPKLEKLNYIERVFINKISNARKVNPKESEHFYCIKMTVAIEIEGIKKGIQTVEERFVLIKAKSFENAYKKVERQKTKYVQPYLNSQGQIVKWNIESFDDCYRTDAITIEDFNNPEGVEVYSKLKTRRIK